MQTKINQGLLYEIIRSPMITEKATKLMELNKVVFKVTQSADKGMIKEAVEKLFDVKVKSVNTLRQKGKLKVFKGRQGRTNSFKKAIVTLEKGQNINLGIGA